MSFSKKRKIYDVSTLSPKQIEKLDTIYDRLSRKAPTNMIPADAGIMHSEVFSPHQEFKAARNEMMFRNYDAWIVFGSDRPSSKASGTGGVGASGANTIDLVVGRMAATRKGKGPKPGTHMDPSFSADAARIYISQLTKVDKNFGLTSGKTTPTLSEQPRSAVAMKADEIRVIARNSIKLVTGKQQGVRGYPGGSEPNSLGAKMHQPAPTIELIAGNSSQERYVFGGFAEPITKISHIQPAVMGDNLKACLKEMLGIMEVMNEALFQHIGMQYITNAILGGEPLLLAYEYFFVTPAGVLVGPAMTDVLEGLVQYILAMIAHFRIMFLEMNYLQATGYKHIVSANVKIT